MYLFTYSFNTLHALKSNSIVTELELELFTFILKFSGLDNAMVQKLTVC